VRRLRDLAQSADHGSQELREPRIQEQSKHPNREPECEPGQKTYRVGWPPAMAAWLVVMEYKLHTAAPCSVDGSFPTSKPGGIA
jgi:hypothetical protein